MKKLKLLIANQTASQNLREISFEGILVMFTCENTVLKFQNFTLTLVRLKFRECNVFIEVHIFPSISFKLYLKLNLLSKRVRLKFYFTKNIEMRAEIFPNYHTVVKRKFQFFPHCQRMRNKKFVKSKSEQNNLSHDQCENYKFCLSQFLIENSV